jgi:hypothetical protein
MIPILKIITLTYEFVFFAKLFISNTNVRKIPNMTFTRFTTAVFFKVWTHLTLDENQC